MTGDSNRTELAAAVAARSRAFERAYRAGDAKRLVEDYFAPDVDDPFASPPGGVPPVRGRAALIAMFASMIPEAPTIRLSSEHLVSSHDVSFEVGRAFLTLRDGTQTIGRYAVCWIRTEDEWRARGDFFATDGWSDASVATPIFTGGNP